MALLLRDVELTTKSGKLVGADVLRNKVVALYFSAQWCPPCRQFTPILRDFYSRAAPQGVEIVWFSRDKSVESMNDYFKEHGNWFRAPFQQPGCKCCCVTVVKEQGTNYLRKYNVDGIPTLIVVKEDGTMEKDVDTVVAEWRKLVGSSGGGPARCPHLINAP